MDVSDLPREAREAIRKGVVRGDAVVEMEFLGLSLRIINLLEDSEYRIIKLQDLLKRSRKEILRIPGMAGTSLNQIYAALARYHELDAVKAQEEKDVKLRMLDDDDTPGSNRTSIWQL